LRIPQHPALDFCESLVRAMYSKKLAHRTKLKALGVKHELPSAKMFDSLGQFYIIDLKKATGENRKSSERS
jgi:hypothetical protein